MTQQVNSLDLDDALRIVAAGEARAAETGEPMDIAVVDAKGDLVLHVRMDGAWRSSVDIAIKQGRHRPGISTSRPLSWPSRAGSSTASRCPTTAM